MTAELRLLKHEDGVLLPVRAQPGARRRAIVGIHDGALKVAVTIAAEKGKANRAIAEVLCDSLGLKNVQVELQSGATSQQKRFLVRGMEPGELERRIASILTCRR